MNNRLSQNETAYFVCGGRRNFVEYARKEVCETEVIQRSNLSL